jgi:hypothetical protein
MELISKALSKIMAMPGTVAHACNPATWEVEIKMIVALGQSGQKVSETPAQETSAVWLYMPVIPGMQRHR